MRSASSIIALARERTNETSYSVNAGVSQESCIEWLNDAQTHLQASIVNTYPQEFVDEYFISVVANQERYNLPDNSFGGGRIIDVFYSQTGMDRDYVRLPPRTMNERTQFEGTNPLFYIRSNGQIYLNPVPQTTNAVVRVSYYRELDFLQESKGIVTSQASSTLTFSGGHTITTGDLYVCVSKPDGTVVLRAAPISSVTGTTIVLSNPITTYLVSGFSASDLVGGSVTAGKYSTTHSKLPNICEKYIRTYLQKRLLAKGSSADTAEEDNELQQMLGVILNTYSQPIEDTYAIPIIDKSWGW